MYDIVCAVHALEPVHRKQQVRVERLLPVRHLAHNPSALDQLQPLHVTHLLLFLVGRLCIAV
jgi:hypothetical protein